MTAVRKPWLEPAYNPPNAPSLHYRAGTGRTFLAALHDALAPEFDLPSSAEPSNAILDAWATVADVLTFYQERIANEGYLGTTTEDISVHELSALVGQGGDPGIAAGTHLAFTLQDGYAVEIPAGTRAQSVPGSGELAQSFETLEPLPARSEWNTLSPRRTRALTTADIAPTETATAHTLYFDGTATRLKPNDLLLLQIREPITGDEAFELRYVTEVTPEPEHDRTKVTVRSVMAPATEDGGGPPVAERAEETRGGPSAPMQEPKARESSPPSVEQGGRGASGRRRPFRQLLSRKASLPALNGGADATRALAANSIGTVPESTPPNAARPSGPPALPTNVNARAGNGQATVSWTTPSDNGGSTITGYIVNVYPNGATRLSLPADASATSLNVGGLNNGTSYTFTVQATNTKGTGPESTRSNAVTPQPTAPGAPMAVSATAGNQSVTVSWSAPSDNGGSAITGYTVNVYPNGAIEPSRQLPAGASATSLSVGGLTNGTSYTFTVQAANSIGPGPESTPSTGSDVSAIPDIVPRTVQALNADAAQDYYTQLANEPVATPVSAYVFRVTATLFGQKAPPPAPRPSGRGVTPPRDWVTADDEAPDVLFLDHDYEQIRPTSDGRRSFVAIKTPYDDLMRPYDVVQVYEIATASTQPRSAYGINATTTRVSIWHKRLRCVDGGKEQRDAFKKRGLWRVNRFLSGDRLADPCQSLGTTPVARQAGTATGAQTTLQRPDAPSGARPVDVAWWDPQSTNPNAFSTWIRQAVVYGQSEPLALAGVPIDAPVGTIDPGRLELATVYADLERGRRLIVAGPRADVPATTDGEVVEIEAVNHLLDPDLGTYRTVLELTNALKNGYDRAAVTLYGNVVASSHGESQRGEVLGSSDGRTPYQTFTLRQSPLTYVNQPGEGAPCSTLQVAVDGTTWSEVATLQGRAAGDRVYMTRRDRDGRTTVTFGDGIEGAVPSSGTENVTADYRSGTGTSGNIPDPGRIRLLATSPLGVKAVTNPVSAAGGVDPASAGATRRAGGPGLVALDRLVSGADYEDIARAAGFPKARTIVVRGPHRTLVQLTVARDDALRPAVEDLEALRADLQARSDPEVVVRVLPRVLLCLFIQARVAVADANRWPAVEASARAALQATFGIEHRELGCSVRASEAVQVLQSVPGIDHVGIPLSVFDAIDGDALPRDPKLPALGSGPMVGSDAAARASAPPQPALLVALLPDLPASVLLEAL